MNMKAHTIEEKVGEILSTLGNPFRIQLALALSGQEACVCHLEALLGQRQAYISQHLMVLREASLLDSRRDGKYIYYRLSDPSVIDLIRIAAALAGLDATQLTCLQAPRVVDGCHCPHCEGGAGCCSPAYQRIEEIHATQT